MSLNKEVSADFIEESLFALWVRQGSSFADDFRYDESTQDSFILEKLLVRFAGKSN